MVAMVISRPEIIEVIIIFFILLNWFEIVPGDFEELFEGLGEEFCV